VPPKISRKQDGPVIPLLILLSVQRLIEFCELGMLDYKLGLVAFFYELMSLNDVSRITEAVSMFLYAPFQVLLSLITSVG